MTHSLRTKNDALAQMKEQEKAMAVKIDQVVALMDDGDPQQYARQERCGGGGGCFPWLRSGRKLLREDRSVDVAVFGQNASSSSTNANARLEKAATRMEDYGEEQYSKAKACQRRAVDLMAQGKQQSALDTLKRAKAHEVLAARATSTHAAIEQQKDILESSALQREVATALSASIATTKKTTKGLLEKVESVVECSAEIRDTVDDVGDVMSGLSTNDQYDEDDLLAELTKMAQEREVETRVHVEPEDTVVGIKPALYPNAPSRRCEVTRELSLRELDAQDLPLLLPQN